MKPEKWQFPSAMVLPVTQTGFHAKSLGFAPNTKRCQPDSKVTLHDLFHDAFPFAGEHPI
jgi:hypothetical protein